MAVWSRDEAPMPPKKKIQRGQFKGSSRGASRGDSAMPDDDEDNVRMAGSRKEGNPPTFMLEAHGVELIPEDPKLLTIMPENAETRHMVDGARTLADDLAKKVGLDVRNVTILEGEIPAQFHGGAEFNIYMVRPRLYEKKHIPFGIFTLATVFNSWTKDLVRGACKMNYVGNMGLETPRGKNEELDALKMDELGVFVPWPKHVQEAIKEEENPGLKNRIILDYHDNVESRSCLTVHCKNQQAVDENGVATKRTFALGQSTTSTALCYGVDGDGAGVEKKKVDFIIFRLMIPEAKEYIVADECVGCGEQGATECVAGCVHVSLCTECKVKMELADQPWSYKCPVCRCPQPRVRETEQPDTAGQDFAAAAAASLDDTPSKRMKVEHAGCSNANCIVVPGDPEDENVEV